MGIGSLERERLSEGKDIRAFAKQIGISRQTYYDLLNGVKNPGGEVMLKLIDYAVKTLGWSYSKAKKEFK